MAQMTAEEAALSLFNTYSDKIYEFAKYSLSNSNDAEDLVQEVFLRVFRTWNATNVDNPQAWLWTIARNCVRDVYRRRGRQKEQPTSDLEQWTPQARGPDTLVEVEDVLQMLNQAERQVVYFRLIEDFSIEDAAKALGWTSVKVRVTLHRAIRKLRDILSAEFAQTQVAGRNPT